jgi:hypothetical protein
LSSVKKQYEIISKAYMGHIAELISKIKDKDNEIKLLKATHEKEITIALKDNELLRKDLEIANLKLKQK